MKIIHCADLHLDSMMDTSLSAEKAEERRNELLDTFIRMIDHADREKVRAVIMAGDVFDLNDSRSDRTGRRMLDRMAASPDMDFLYLHGNHDKDSFMQSDRPSNLKMLDNAGEEWTYYDYDDVVIAGCGGPYSPDKYSGLSLRPDKFNIAVMHGQICRSDTTDSGIMLDRLKSRNINYLALGHIHSFSRGQLDERGIWCYSGCLEGRGFDECGEKGFVQLEIHGNRAEYTFAAAAKRVFHEVRADVSDCRSEAELIEKIRNMVSGIPQKDMLKLVMTGETDDAADIDTVYITKRFSGDFYCFRAEDDTRTRIDEKKYRNDVSLRSEFIRTVKAKKDIDEDSRSRVMMLGLKALSGREIDI